MLGLGTLPIASALAGTGQERFSPAPKALAGKRWAMVVDINKCDNCMKCQRACHAAHNVPDIKDREEEVKWIWSEPFEKVFPGLENKYVGHGAQKHHCMVMCNHCENPACVRVCPTKATYKREDGIVMMDYHRCVGCRYCMAACPYGARSFNFQDPRPCIKQKNLEYPTRRKGVVEKCNFCAERLAAGLLPLCVEACPRNVLAFGDLENPHSQVRKLLTTRLALQRRVELGTHPNVYYLV